MKTNRWFLIGIAVVLLGVVLLINDFGAAHPAEVVSFGYPFKAGRLPTEEKETGRLKPPATETPWGVQIPVTGDNEAGTAVVCFDREPTPQATPLGCPPSCNAVENPAFEKRVLELVNQEREGRGLPTLTLHPRLVGESRQHSMDMACGNYFSHNDRSGATPFERMDAQQYANSTAAENIYAGREVYNSPDMAVRAWMNSPGHRVNILNPEFIQAGVGVWYNEKSFYGGYFDMDFGSP